jgi:hypothetical protein
LAAQVGLALVWNRAHHLPFALALEAAAFAGLACAARRLEAEARPGRAILLGSLLLRLPLLSLPLTLSDDALRYLWDGRVAMAGQNPYALAPMAPELAPFRDRAGGLPPHPDVPTVYPPLAVAAFSIASRLPFPLFAWKLLVSGADLGGCALLLALARRRGVPEGRVAWYAWNPLVLLEVSGMGHVDALGAAAAVGAVLCLTARPARPPRPMAASVWAAAGVLAKLVPLAALPLWSLRSGKPGRFLGACAVLLAAAGLPVIAATGGVPPGLVAYARSWEFDGPLFEPLWRLLAAVGAGPFLAGRVAALERRTEMWQAWDFLYPLLYPQLLAKALLALGMIAAVLASLRERDAVAGTGRLFGFLLLLSATVYPWYLLWVLPWAALVRHPAWLALSGLVLLSYLPRALGVPLVPWIYLAIWAPFALLLALGPGWEPSRGQPREPSPA